jgi:hypothetical protein
MKIKYKPKEKSIVAVATEEEVTMVFILLQMVWMINDETHLNYFFAFRCWAYIIFYLCVCWNYPT